jgi:hypothetical protein
MSDLLQRLEPRRLFAALTLTGTAGDDSWTVRLKAGDPATVEVLESLDSGPVVTYSAATATTTVDMAGGAGFDLLLVDNGNGRVPDLQFLGGTDGDEIEYRGGGSGDAIGAGALLHPSASARPTDDSRRAGPSVMPARR